MSSSPGTQSIKGFFTPGFAHSDDILTVVFPVRLHTTTTRCARTRRGRRAVLSSHHDSEHGPRRTRITARQVTAAGSQLYAMRHLDGKIVFHAARKHCKHATFAPLPSLFLLFGASYNLHLLSKFLVVDLNINAQHVVYFVHRDRSPLQT